MKERTPVTWPDVIGLAVIGATILGLVWIIVHAL